MIPLLRKRGSGVHKTVHWNKIVATSHIEQLIGHQYKIVSSSNSSIIFGQSCGAVPNRDRFSTCSAHPIISLFCLGQLHPRLIAWVFIYLLRVIGRVWMLIDLRFITRIILLLGRHVWRVWMLIDFMSGIPVRRLEMSSFISVAFAMVCALCSSLWVLSAWEIQWRGR